jgi:hypothetical protein
MAKTGSSMLFLSVNVLCRINPKAIFKSPSHHPRPTRPVHQVDDTSTLRVTGLGGTPLVQSSSLRRRQIGKHRLGFGGRTNNHRLRYVSGWEKLLFSFITVQSLSLRRQVKNMAEKRVLPWELRGGDDVAFTHHLR